MSENFQFKTFVELVSEMREAQKQFFATRQSAYMDKAKRLEKKVDEFISNNQGSNKNSSKQNTLF